MTYVIDRSDLGRLASEVRGPVLAPGDDDYAEETATWNQAQVERPAVVVGATNVADVQAAVRFAGVNDLPVATVATGHGAVVASDGAVMVNIRRLRDIVVDTPSRSATIGGAVTAKSLIDAAFPEGLAPLAGSSPNVGVVGYALGGGLSSTLGRTYGWAADHVRSADIVTPDGELRHIDAGHEPDLFWAIRGGKGNFGVVTSLDLDLVPTTELYGGGIYFAGEHVGPVIDAFRRLVAESPQELTLSFAFMRLPDHPDVPEPLRDRFTVHVRVAYLGPPAEGERLVTGLRAAAPALADTVAEMPYTEIAAIHQDPLDPVPTYEMSTLLSDFPAAAEQALIDVAGPGVDTPAAMIEIRQLGGALGQDPSVPNAVGNRDARFQLFGGAFGAGPGLGDRFRAPLNAISGALAPWSTGHQQANFLTGYDLAPEAVARAYEPATYHRLRDVKRTYDPGNMFRINHNIPPEP
ncbi:FAD/FMN-containing dehydrogenase [Asanoa hainanensis]|uniref:FAD/FMN-containing dehydrogenase n=1 Tax=Asanoa hainanensis TaxID=560556 RepID=A0A239PCB9_9ACTN|nr:FAD-binding oxidoreductase [Asanoa hainanensis]SNT64623.1 FAD/FMN-containing dehydrogenase [Asanoa hainanensis]